MKNIYSLKFQASHTSKIPEPGHVFHVSWLTDKNVTSDFTVNTPDHLNLPSIPENVRILI
jgi:hypothetical protein